MLAKGIVLQAWAKSAFSCMLAAMIAPAALAHSVQVSAHLTEGVQVRAVYDTGQPMAQAQVALFAPNNPAQVWARGRTDNDGIFRFVPDAAQSGAWTVQVRQAGHGAIVSITTGNATTQMAAASAPEQTLTQKLVMAALVAWGALGTALFFRRRKGSSHAST